MKFQDFTATTGSGFTLVPTPINADMAWIIAFGQICERVTSAPGPLQYTLVGSALNTGWTKAAGDGLYIFIEDSSTLMLIPEIPVGVKDGTNRIYTIQRTIPSNSEPVVIHNGMILQPGGSGANTYTRVGVTITLSASHPAPLASDTLVVLVTATKTTGAQFGLFPLTGPEDGINHFFSISNAQVFGFDHQTLLFQPGRAAPVTTGVPAPLRHTYDQSTGFLYFGSAPAPLDRETLYVIGQTIAVDNPFQVWLDTGAPRVALAELTLAQGSTTKQVYYASRNYATDPSDVPANLQYLGHLTGIPRVKRAMQGAFTGQSLVSYTNMELVNGEGQLDADFGEGGWSTDGQPCNLYLTGVRKDLAFVNRQQVFAGIMDPAQRQSDKVVIPLRDMSKRLARKFSMSVLDNVTWPNLPDTNNGRFIPLLFGRIKNLTPFLVDPNTLTYFTGFFSAVEAVYDNGISVPFILDPNPTNNNRFLLLSQPVGQITCDVRGQSLGSFSAKLGDLIEGILRTFAGYGDADFNVNALTIFQSQVRWDAGLVVTEPTPIGHVLDTLLAGIPAYYFISRSGQFTIGLVQTTLTRAPALTFDRATHSLASGGTITIQQPKWRVNLGYAPIETVQQNLVTFLTQARKERLQQQFLTQSALDSNTLVTYPEAEDEAVIQTRICDIADIQALALMRLSLYKVAHVTVQETFDVVPVRVDMGDIVGYTSDRYHLGAANPRWLVIGLEETLGLGRGNSRIGATLWQ